MTNRRIWQPIGTLTGHYWCTQTVVRSWQTIAEHASRRDAEAYYDQLVAVSDRSSWRTVEINNGQEIPLPAPRPPELEVFPNNLEVKSSNETEYQAVDVTHLLHLKHFIYESLEAKVRKEINYEDDMPDFNIFDREEDEEGEFDVLEITWSEQGRVMKAKVSLDIRSLDIQMFRNNTGIGVEEWSLSTVDNVNTLLDLARRIKRRDLLP